LNDRVDDANREYRGLLPEAPSEALEDVRELYVMCFWMSLTFRRWMLIVEAVKNASMEPFSNYGEILSNSSVFGHGKKMLRPLSRWLTEP
jgi:hypothetical protein